MRLAYLALALLWASFAWSGEKVGIGFSADFFTGINENDAVAAMKVWSESVARNRGLVIDSRVAVYSGGEQLAEALAAGKSDLLIVLSPEMVSLRKQGLIEPQFVSLRGGSAEEEYLMLVHRDSDIKDLAGLRHKSVMIQSSARASLASLWLDSELRKHGMDLQGGSLRVERGSKISKVVLPVFFKKTDACLVTRNGYSTLCEFNPQLSKHLVVLASSPGYVPTTICFRKGYGGEIRDDLYKGLADLHKGPHGQQVLMLFKVDALKPYEPELMENVENLLEMKPLETDGTLARKDAESRPQAKAAHVVVFDE